MKTITNNIYKELIQFVKDHHGYSGQDFKDHPDIREKEKQFIDQIKQIEGKKVKIKFYCEMDFLSTGGEKTGKIVFSEDNRIKFFEGIKRTRFYYLDAGLHLGFFATLIPLQIDTI
jgi:uncharacterized FlgJ-related protein